ncbi:MAG: hypothetical protein WEF86_10970 [Gemmatimonadota bacterium]
MNTHDARTERRMTRLSALLEADFSDDIAARASAARMRPVVIAAAAHAHRAAQRTLLLRAAAIVVLLGGVAAVPPARAWVVEHVLRLAAALGVSRADSPASGDATGRAPGSSTGDPAQADADVRYSFDVAGPVIVVRIDATAGTLVLRRGADDTAGTGTAAGTGTGTSPGSAPAAGAARRASAETIDAPGTRFLVLPDGIAIATGDATAAARFIITVPLHVREARVVLADGSAHHVAVAVGETTVRIGGLD